MSKKTQNNTLACAVGAVLVGSLAGTGVVNAAENPFGMTELQSGYMQLASKEGACGEGKCGGDMKKKAEGACGEGKCGEGKCGADMKKKAEGACGEGKCGGEMKKKAEGACGEGKCGGEMKKKKEGACGEGKCGGKY